MVRSRVLSRRLCCGVLLAGWLVAVTTAAGAAPLQLDPEGPDPVASLDADRIAAARALGEALRAIEAGRLDEVPGVLSRVEEVAALAGHAAWLRVRLLLAEGRAREAHDAAHAARDSAPSEALRAALAVLQGEALAAAGDVEGAERVWRALLDDVGTTDAAVRNTVQLAIVRSRQRTGSLDAGTDPRLLLDRAFEDTVASAEEVPLEALPAPVALDRAQTALDRGRADQALSLFERAISGPLDAAAERRARHGRGLALFRSRQYDAADRQFAALLPDLEARFWRARSRARLGDVDGALAGLAQVAEGADEDLASWASYLAGTLHEERGEIDRAIVMYARAAASERFVERARLALWRAGWARFRSGAHGEARASFRELEGRLDDPIDRLRPRYWAARAALAAGDAAIGLRELGTLAREYPITYYGWRAVERLADGAPGGLVREPGPLDRGGEAEEGGALDEEAVERAALLIAGGLEDLARDELRFAARRVRGLADQVRVGRLLVRVGDYHRASRLVLDAHAHTLARGVQSGRESLWWLAWPPAYREAVGAIAASEARIDRELIWAIMREESHYRAEARSVVGALGLLQLMPTTAAPLAERMGIVPFEDEDLFDPRTNIALGTAYLAQIAERFDGRLSATIGSYNAGPSRVSSWLQGEAAQLEDDVWVESIPYDQTRAYVKRVLRSYVAYKRLYR